MNGFSYENQGNNTYLVYSLAAEDNVDTMSLGMLTNNKIPGLAPAIFTQMDTSKFIKYNVSSHISVKQFFSGPVNKKRLIGVFSGIVDAMLSAEDYMIDVNSIIMDLDYIFADVSTCETILICMPIVDMEMPSVDLGAFFKNIMFATQFDQTENCDHVAKIMNYLNSTPVFSLTDFKELLSNVDTAASGQPVVNRPQPVAAPPVKSVPEVKPTVAPAASPVKQAPVKPPISPVQPPVANKPVSAPQPQVPPVKAVQAPQPQSAVPEKEISMFGLLMHYSKENAAAYKAQKAAKKNGGKAPAPTPAQPQPKQAPAAPGFAVPGQNNNPGFAVPGQAPTPPAAQPRVPAQRPAVQSPARPATPPAPAPAPAPAPKPAFVPREVAVGNGANFGETTVLGGGMVGETTVLTAANNPMNMIAPHLMRKKNSEKISLNKPVFRIGKEKSYVDYFIGDNTAISRSHANFIVRDDKYYVVDTNSTNHTFVNGTMIQSNVETEISHGDAIRLANEEFEFKLY